MPDGQGPSIKKRRLRTELKSLREHAGLSQAEVFAKLDWSQSKLIRIENGTVGVSVTDVRALAGLYKATEDTVDELVALARAARERRWWAKYRDLVPPQLQEFIGYEADATTMRQFHPTLVPGLLQIEAYIRAVGPDLMLNPTPEDRYEAYVEVRLRRQEKVLHLTGGKAVAGKDTEPVDRPQFIAIMDEGVLHRRVGGPANMQAQLRHLADLQTAEVVSLGIVPFSAGAHFGMMGAFHIFDFADDADDSVLYMASGESSAVLKEKPELVAQYATRFDDLLRISVTGDDAVTLLHKISDEMS